MAHQRRLILLSILAAAAALLNANEAAGAPSADERSVLGDFSIAGFLSVGAGWQRFSDAPVTEWASDGSFAGVLGSVLHGVQTGVPPQPQEDTAMAFVEVLELDITKSLGKRTTLGSHIWLGRANSGSWVLAPGATLEQGYITVLLSPSHNVEFKLGRFTTEAGYEYDEPYFNDTISWSIMARGNLYPYYVTGAQLAFDIIPGARLFLNAVNGNINETTMDRVDVPSGYASLVIAWGPEERQSTFVLTPFVGPESGSDRPLSYGANATASLWLSPRFELGLEGTYHRDDGAGGPATNYAGGLVNLHVDVTPRVFGVARYAFARQFEAGNGVWNLTGAEQAIHEMSLGGGLAVADGMKLKWEARADAVVPDASATQWVPGFALGMDCAF